ncbi:hypothetical protein ACFT7S_10810 [Streptomyces sp. NPDC057136]|uniref:hypothetical protein n=1 Tax=Streptomyces sp. NPDC057136 TaxID=3346029 RepID=UPI0036295F71
MQRGLVHAIAWSLATGAAVTLSWWGVHTVMAGTAYDPPRAVPLTVGARTGQGTQEPVSSSTHRAAPSPSSPATTPRTTPPASRVPSRPPSRTPSSSPAPAQSPGASSASGEVKSYRTDGGRAVFELGSSSAKLVSATPEQDWSMQVWTNTTWIRVNFSDETGATYSLFCTWNDHPPQVQIVGP